MKRAPNPVHRLMIWFAILIATLIALLIGAAIAFGWWALVVYLCIIGLAFAVWSWACSDNYKF